MMRYILITSTSAEGFQQKLNEYSNADWAVDVESFNVTESPSGLTRFSILVEKGDDEN